MANKYVSTAGGGDGSSAIAPMTLKQAMAECLSGTTYILAAGTYTQSAGANEWMIDTKAPAALVTFKSASGVAADVIITNDGSAWQGSLYLYKSTNFAFEDITFDAGSGAAANYAAYLRADAIAASVLTFTRCNFIDDLAGKMAIEIESTSALLTLTMTNCNVTVSSTCRGLFAYAASIATLTITGGTWTHTGSNGSLLDVRSAAQVKVSGVTFDSTQPTGDIVSFKATAASSRLSITGCTVIGRAANGNWAIYAADYWTNVYIANNSIFSLNNADPVGLAGICCGYDADTTANPMGQVIVHDNLVQSTGSTAHSSHGMLLGSGADGAQFYNNTILLCTEAGSGVNIGMVFKAERCIVHHNIITGSRGLLCKGASYSNISYNTIKALETYAISIDPGATNTIPSKCNNFENNIIDATAGTYAIYENQIFGAGGDPIDNRFDFNCYFLGTAKAGYFGSDKADLAALKTYWAAVTNTLWILNDANSIVADPQLSGTFTLGAASPCLNAGRPTPGSGLTTIGAWQRRQGNVCTPIAMNL